MPYVDDLVASNKEEGECFNIEAESFDFVTSEVAKQLFPGVELQESPYITYFPFKLCHSLPKVNSRGRAFTHHVLRNSFSSLVDQLIDWDHQLVSNNIGAPEDRIIGFVKTTRFDMPAEMAEQEVAKASVSTPVMGLGCLFKRAEGVDLAIKRHQEKKEKWGVSMECGHRWKDAYFLYDNEFIPVPEAELAMRQCVEPAAVKPYKGKPLAVCLGGLKGTVPFWGVGFTQSPSDDQADILSFIGARHKEVASRKIFSMPLARFSQMELEVAHSSVDKKIQEIANLEVIGETDPSEDGHRHQVLSNLTVLPTNGHSHSVLYSGGTVILKRGSKPALTGVTDQYQTPYSSSSGYSGVSSGNGGTHLHLINIPLRGKKSTAGATELGSEEETVLTAEEVANMSKTFDELFEQLTKLTTRMASVNTDAERNQLNSELASNMREIQELRTRQTTQKDKDDYVEAMIKDGKLLRKEVADQQTEQAVKENTEKLEKQFEETRKTEQVVTERLHKCIQAGIDLDSQYQIGDKPIMKGDKPYTVRDKVMSIPVEDTYLFDAEFVTLTNLFPPPKPDDKTQQQQQLTEAANKPAPRRVTALVSSGSPGTISGNGNGKEVANTGVPKHLRGRSAITARN